MHFKKKGDGVPIVAQWKRIWLASMRTQVRSPALLSQLRIRRCRELWCRSQTQLQSGVAMALASRLQLWFDPSLETSICRGCGPEEAKKTQKLKNKKKGERRGVTNAAPSYPPAAFTRVSSFILKNVCHKSKVSTPLHKLNNPPPPVYQGEERQAALKPSLSLYSFSFWSNQWFPTLCSSAKQFKVY